MGHCGEIIAVGGWLTEFTVTFTGVEPERLPSDTVNMKVKVSPFGYCSGGAVNVAMAPEALLIVTEVPTVWVHAYVRASPSGSEDVVPSNVTVPPSLTTEGVAVADAMGAWSAWLLFCIAILVDLL